MEIRRIRLDNQVFEGKNSAYLIESGGQRALIDTGVATPKMREQLTAGLAAHDCSLADVDLVALTHYHADHAGLAGTVQAADGATVLVHEADAPLVARHEEAVEDLRARQRAAFREWGIPEAKRDELRPILDTGDWFDPAADPTPVADGEEIEVGDCTLRVVHSPGHTAGLSCFEFTDSGGRRGAFVGDAILPSYTPNVGGADLRVERPLERYAATLRRIERREYDRAWPGHRDPIASPSDRARAILEHHRERTERVVQVLREHGPADPWTVSAQLFGELEGIHILHGPGEAYAHLDHLRHRGVVERTSGEYRLLDRSPAVDELV